MRRLWLAVICLVLSAAVSGCGGSRTPASGTIREIQLAPGPSRIAFPQVCRGKHHCPRLFVLAPDPDPWDRLLAWLDRTFFD